MSTPQPSTEMTIPAILEKLTPYTGRFPKAAVQAAIAQREAITPHLLQALEDVANAPAEFAGRKDYMLHTFATYLLAQFREKERAAPCPISASPSRLQTVYSSTRSPSRETSSPGNEDRAAPTVGGGDGVYEYVRGSAVESFRYWLKRANADEVPRYYQVSS